MSSPQETISWETNNVKRRRLLMGKGETTDEFTTQMTIDNIPDEDCKNFVIEEESKIADDAYATHCPEGDDVTPKRNLRTRTRLNNSVLMVEKALKNGERGWSSEVKDKLISILENDNFYGDLRIGQKNYRTKVLTHFDIS
ncbi:hypothetical protein DAPPUDRAFT_102315 [Daphnia pulex]|uniref:Uncharacterized protein n=1 Tax=Daphnia pulex TaxID=6669 RepID=E9GG22_DAPPU|nr:hypothetical protein DAPPUDRAFT_102315 [Daphnia pulex]|eukprot:EFX81572.1 hypothetical protein DAPPUDRAFT_102315 [Daphnia pulex]